ncbi:GNAT family N-acetyltransferase, partial [Thermobifida halotolerans]
MRVLLETERLVLREFAETDADHLYALNSDPAVMRFINGGRPVAFEAVRTEELPHRMRRHPRTGECGYWAAEDRDGRFLGWFEFRPLDAEDVGTVELGYRLRAAAWGRGYATEGARALVRRGFTGTGAARVVAFTMAVNARSRRVMEKTGLRYVRTFHRDWPEPIDGAEHGEV